MTKEEVIDTLSGVDQVDDLFRAAESQEQHKERVRRINEAIAIAAKKLKNATIWTPCTERMPTEDDADGYGDVNTIDHDGTTCFLQWDEVEFASNVYAWSRIETIGGGK